MILDRALVFSLLFSSSIAITNLRGNGTSGRGAEAHALFKQYEYRVNSSLVLATDSRLRDTYEPIGEPKSLWGKIDPRNFGDRVYHGKAAELEEAIKKAKKTHSGETFIKNNMSLVANKYFQHILLVLNTNVNGRQKSMFALTSIKGIGRRLDNHVCKNSDLDMNKRELNQCLAAEKLGISPPKINGRKARREVHLDEIGKDGSTA